MKSRRQLCLLVSVVVAVSACSSTPDYVYKTDMDYIQKVEASNKYSSGAARVYWVNPPKKRIPVSDNKQD